MAENILRKYYLADDVMLERAQRFHDLLEGELVSFSTRFTWMDATWLDAFQTDIDTADGYATDENVILDQHVLTEDTRSAMELGYAALTALGRYAQLAFPTDKARQRAFGQKQWTAVRFNPLKLQEALELAHSKAEEPGLKGPLLNKGYDQSDIDGLENLSEELKLKNRLKESAKLDRKVNSRDRVMLLNQVWQHMQTISTCAKVVWKADAERMGQYQLYPSRKVGGDEQTS